MMGGMDLILLAWVLALQFIAAEGSILLLLKEQQDPSHDLGIDGQSVLTTVNQMATSQSKEAPTTGVADGRTCCPSGQDSAAYASANDRCEFGSYVSDYISLNDDEVLKCCFDTNSPHFYYHYADFQQGLVVPLDIKGGDVYNTDFCKLGLKWNIKKLRLANNWIRLLVNLNVDCATYNETDEEWITIYLDKSYQHAGKFTYEISAIGPTIYADIDTKVNSDSTLELRVHITGTGIIGRLDETVSTTIKDAMLKEFLKEKEICPL